MHLTQIKLAHFKNYSELKASFSSQFNAFVGKNGMGKTNLLDAIYYLAFGKSHFRIPDNQLMQKGASFFRLESSFQISEKTTEIIIKVSPKKQKVIEKDGKKYKRLSDHIGTIPVVMIAPDDTLIGTGGSEDRRRLMDETICQVDKNYLTKLNAYNKLIKQRNAALKMLAKNQRWDENLIASFDEQLVGPALV
ncbi:MAG: AAA family ATPase, partial [Saprospiraceae bacterium]|nr:AAA family ATPase [Saprospiraceae bacterium]